MITIGNPEGTPRTRPSKFAALSFVLHLCLLSAFITVAHEHAVWIAPMRLPGTDQGTRFLLDYLPGKAPIQTTVAQPKARVQQAALIPALPLPKLPHKDPTPSPNTNSPATDHPDSPTGSDARGIGQVKIALPDFFPTPRPDLSALPRGTRGDVILDVVIDTAGKISDIKITNGLGHGVDETVIATVQQWTFHPATQNGQPVASEQELHFHYETRG